MKFYSLALLAVLLAATTANAGEVYNYNNSLADCGCQSHSWKNGCCDRQRSCCDHLWLGYCHDHGCRGMHLPVPSINWNCLHTNAPAYQMPCLRLPKILLPGHCASDCCSEAPACDEACTAGDSSCAGGGCCHSPVLDWIQCVLHRDSPNCSCGHAHPVKNFASQMHAKLHHVRHLGRGCATGCCGEETMSLETSPSEATPPNDLPPEMPPAPTIEPRDTKEESEQDTQDNETASLWLLPSLSL